MKFLNKFKWFILGGMVFAVGGVVLAVQVTVPSGVGPGFLLQSLTSGNYGTASLIAGTNVTISTTSTSITISSSGVAGSVGNWFSGFPNYNATSTTIGFLNGLFSTASSTFSSTLTISTTTAGCATFSSTGLLFSTGVACGTGSGGGSFPFTAFPNYNATTTVIGFNGLFSTASSTFGGDTFFTNLTAGMTYIGSLGRLNGGVATGTVSAGSSAITVTAGRSVLNGALSIDCATASGSQNGCLSSGDWTTFNNKQGTISVSFPIQLTGSALSFVGLSTSSAGVISNVPYFSGVNTFANEATGTVTCAGTASCGAGSYVLGNALTITGSGGGGTFPFTAFPNYVATSTTVGFLNGLFSTASSTFNSAFRLPALSAGQLNVDPNGLVYSGASTTFSSGLTYSNGNVTCTGCSAGTAGVAIETPSGTINGANPVFTVTNNPVQVFVNGALQIAGGTDYTLTGTGPYTITFVFPPLSGSNLQTLYGGVSNGSVNSGTAGQMAYYPSNGTTLSGTPLANILGNSYLAIGTSTAPWLLDLASSTQPQLALSAGGGISQWTMRNAGSYLYIATTTVDGLSTSTTPAFTLSSNGWLGIGTSTPGFPLSVVGGLLTTATSTGMNGFNLTTGCFAIRGTCITGGAGGATQTLTTNTEVDCNMPQTDSTDFAPGGSFWTAIGNTAGMWNFDNATSSTVFCQVTIPDNISSTPNGKIIPFLTATSSTGTNNLVFNVEATTTDWSTNQNWNPSAGSWTVLLNASTTPASRIKLIATGAQLPLTSTTTISTSGLNLIGGYTLLIRIRRYGADANDTVENALLMPKVIFKYDINVN